ncbi:MAG: hypothetical protein FWG66_04285 [Spirochaetes bacterium]|nr:hypothetical protein [Spirochaetota bacterium]
MKHFNFDKAYSLYANGSIGRRELEEAVFRHILANARKFYPKNSGEDERADFVSWLYPKIRRAIDIYRNVGSSFEAYIHSVVRLSVKEYRWRRTEMDILKYATWVIKAYQQYLRQAEPEYSRLENAAPARKVKNPRQLLILALKCYCYVSEGFLEKIAARLGVPAEVLREMFGRLREARRKRDERMRRLRESVQGQNCRCLVYKKRISLLKYDTNTRMRMEVRLEKALGRRDAMQARLEGISPFASNGQVVCVLGLSKGSADASLFQLKAKWKMLQGGSLLN